jgi:AcrR family transcriptional regulator
MTEPTGERTSVRSRENTRARLMEAAYEVFGETGLDAASVEMICERAGFTRGAFYSNFESKEELFLALADAVAQRKLGSVSDRVRDLQEQGVAPSSVGQIAQAVLDVALEDRLGVVLMSELKLRAMRDDATAEAYRRWELGVHARVQGIVEGLVASYGLRLRVPVEDLARLVVDVWESTATSAVIERLDHEQMWILATARIEQLAVALVEEPARD